MPAGDQAIPTGYYGFTCYPVRIAIFEGEDGPLETVPDPQRKTANAVDFNLASRPGMVMGKVDRKK